MVFLCSPFFLPPSLATQLGLRWQDSGGGLFDRNILRFYPLSFPKLYASAHTYYLHSLQCWLTDLTGAHLIPCVAKSQVVCVPPIGSMRRFPSICFPRSLRLAISLRSGFRSCGLRVLSRCRNCLKLAPSIPARCIKILHRHDLNWRLLFFLQWWYGLGCYSLLTPTIFCQKY